jgi:hypothetical protein
VNIAVVPVVATCVPPGLAVAVYPPMGLPPSLVGAVQVTVADPMPAVATTAVGAPGTFGSVIAAEGCEAGPVPAAFVAVTTKVYVPPFASPETMAVVAPAVDDVKPPGLEVTV